MALKQYSFAFRSSLFDCEKCGWKVATDIVPNRDKKSGWTSYWLTADQLTQHLIAEGYVHFFTVSPDETSDILRSFVQNGHVFDTFTTVAHRMGLTAFRFKSEEEAIRARLLA